MQTLICPSCGLEKNKNLFVGQICKACFYKEKAKFEVVMRDIIICRSCARLKVGFSWKAFAEEVFEELIKSNIKSNLEYQIKDLDLTFLKSKLIANVTIKVGKDVLEDTFTFVPKYQYCSDCYKKMSDFFEAVVQLRGFGNTKQTQKEFLKMLDKIKKEELKKGNFGAYLQKQEIEGEGIDYYLGSKHLAISFIREIKDQYNVDKKESFKLVGILPGGKDKVRTTYLIRKHEEKTKQENDYQK
jgi:NMD protein affecting ribosome stability and mRNA decay